MPLADAGRDVARGSKRAPDGDFIERQIFRPRRHQQLRIFRRQAGNPICDMKPRGIFTGQDCRACGGTHRAGRIGLRKLHPVTREPVEVRRLVQVAAVTRQIGPTEIIGQNQDDVRLGLCRNTGKRQTQKAGQTKNDPPKSLHRESRACVHGWDSIQPPNLSPVLLKSGQQHSLNWICCPCETATERPPPDSRE